ncbi:ABC transporter ATP-binding protein [Falsirhodobacter sp. 20TX0035]|uniref:ABC transporter ATP-binding protein n=1 Tax=Falsirhodobacter sp. 20TX0035 TaxID=3022019 RepID=UPI002330324B|nr:ABC transporter ATP-binding protein [Falsirhodobacter sp. 20TX0035]MDB6452911.1 ABC transporter ATP-binding protein [Falsirhodobacter sp. 20TX0035]
MSVLSLTCPALHRGPNQILPALALDFAPGGMIGVTGPNGSGKSTLLRAIAGLGPETVGLRQNGQPLAREAVSLLPQNFTIRSSLSVLDCVLLGQRKRLGLRVPPALITEARALLDGLGLADLADRPMNRLSGGQQQRVLIAQRLFAKPRLLLLDEPTSALDLHHQLAALSLLQTHARRSGTVVIAALHDLTLAARFCDRLLVLGDGRICADGPAEDALAPATVEACWNIRPEYLKDRDNRLVVIPHLPA